MSMVDPCYIVASVPRIRNAANAEDLQRAAFEIADETCRSDIEVLCYWTVVDGTRWYDTRKVSDEEDTVRVLQALVYLVARGEAIVDFRLRRHSEQPALVRFKEVLR